MLEYLLRRLLLMIPTFFGITILVFTILQIVPGGPLEQEMMRLRSAMMAGGGETQLSTSGNYQSGVEIPEESLNQLKSFYGLDKPAVVRYLIWLGVYPKITQPKNVKVSSYCQNILASLYGSISYSAT